MMTASDIRELTSLSSESRQTVTGAFEALEQWRDDIFSANERHLTKVLDRLAATQRATGWPDQFATAAGEHLLKASKMQTHMIDQVMDAWEHRLKTPDVPLALPEGFKSQTSPSFGAAFTDPMSEMMRLHEMTLAPFKLWIQAAEMWQRSWADLMSASAKPRPSRPIKKASS